MRLANGLKEGVMKAVTPLPASTATAVSYQDQARQIRCAQVSADTRDQLIANLYAAAWQDKLHKAKDLALQVEQITQPM